MKILSHSENIVEYFRVGISCSSVLFSLLFFSPFLGGAQIRTKVQVEFSPITRTIAVKQRITYRNTTGDTLHRLYLNDWNNAFSQKDAPLGKHFSKIYIRRFHFSTLHQRGETRVDFIRSSPKNPIRWNRPEGHPDIISVTPKFPVANGDSIQLELRYTLRIPEDKFTHYGRNESGNYHLKNWLILPANYREGWVYYSNKGLDDIFQPLTSIRLEVKLPKTYTLASNLQVVKRLERGFSKKVYLTGERETRFKLSLVHDAGFEEYYLDSLKVVTDMENFGLPYVTREGEIRRMISFLEHHLGKYPYQKFLIRDADYRQSAVYGLNQLPDFLRPFPDDFQYEIKMLKTLTRAYVENTLLLNPRKEGWLQEATEIFLMMKYIEQYHPDKKLVGKLSKVFGIRWTHLAKMGFNAQYQLLFMNMNRLNLDQGLTVSKDSLLKFNREMANPYKAGIGFAYLDDYLRNQELIETLRQFYQRYRLKPVSSADFMNVLKQKSTKSVDWFFKDYVNSDTRIDFKIATVKEREDSLEVTVRNKESNNMPVAVYGLTKDRQIISKYWLDSTRNKGTLKIPRKNVARVGLNVEGIIPEINQRNNYKNLNGLFNKPLQFRLLKDVEDPHYIQFFFLPEFNYNLYDGISLGSRISNQAVLTKRWKYNIVPQYGFTSGALVGRLSLVYDQQFRDRHLSDIYYGGLFNRFSYARDLFYHRFSPFITFNWRDKDLRKKKGHTLTIRDITVNRQHADELKLEEKPDYSVFDLRYQYHNQDLINTYRATFDYQLGKKFSKISLTAKYRKLFLNNHQLEFRLFAGMFLSNHTDKESNYFDFALDRPSDYLFDYNYYGRSEDHGLFSQQFIESEGGFKSKLSPGFSDYWLASLNSSVSLYRDVAFVYGDFGILKNRGAATKVRYDSGIRLSLLQDYFELFFPVYSSRGWEFQKDYSQRIRFIVTLDFQTLMSLFTRTYY